MRSASSAITPSSEGPLQVQWPARVALVHHESLTRAGLVALIELDPDLLIAGASSTLDEGLLLLSTVPVDVVLLQYHLGGGRYGVDFICSSRKAGFQGNFVIIADTLADAEALLALRAGAIGFVLKTDSADTLREAIKKVHHDEFWVPERYLKLLVGSLGPTVVDVQLSGREVAVLRGVINGESNKEIASVLGLTEPAVKGALQRIFRKTGTRTRGQLSRITIERYGDLLR